MKRIGRNERERKTDWKNELPRSAGIVGHVFARQYLDRGLVCVFTTPSVLSLIGFGFVTAYAYMYIWKRGSSAHQNILACDMYYSFICTVRYRYMYYSYVHIATYGTWVLLCTFRALEI